MDQIFPLIEEDKNVKEVYQNIFLLKWSIKKMKYNFLRFSKKKVTLQLRKVSKLNKKFICNNFLLRLKNCFSKVMKIHNYFTLTGQKRYNFVFINEVLNWNQQQFSELGILRYEIDDVLVGKSVGNMGNIKQLPCQKPSRWTYGSCLSAPLFFFGVCFVTQVATMTH